MLQAVRSSLTPAELRVADFLSAHPDEVIEMSISELGSTVGVSDSTISRLCGKLGRRGFPQLKIALAQALERNRPPLSGNVSLSDGIETMIQKVCAAEVRDIQDTAALLERSSVARAVSFLDEADRVLVYGAGPIGLLAKDAAQKLQRVGLASWGFSDLHLAMGAMPFLNNNDVALALSYSGQTRDTCDFLRAARRNGVHTVAITSAAGSTITAEADIVLLAASNEGPFRTGATSSRVAQLVVVDVMFTALAARRYERTVHAYQETYDSLGAYRVKGRDPRE